MTMRKIVTPQLRHAVETVVGYLMDSGEYVHWLSGIECDHVWHSVRYLGEWLAAQKLPEMSEKDRLGIELELSHRSRMQAIAAGDLNSNDIAVAEITEVSLNPS
jgi:hypothetical protein